MKIQKLLSALFIALTFLTFSACNSSDDNQDMQYSNIVTFLGNTDGRASFTYQEMNDAQPVTIYSNTQVSGGDLKPGDRLLIIFSVPATTTSITNGTVVTLHQAVKVPTVTVQPGEVPTDFTSTPALYIQTLFRSGTWLNMQCLVPSTSTNITFELIADRNTLDNADVQLYLVYKNSEVNNNIANAAYYVTFNIESVWNLATCRSITVNTTNSNSGIEGAVTFRKN